MMPFLITFSEHQETGSGATLAIDENLGDRASTTWQETPCQWDHVDVQEALKMYGWHSYEGSANFWPPMSRLTV